MGLATVVDELFDHQMPIEVEAFDGSRAGPSDAPARLVVRSPDAVARVATHPGELGLVRAYVAGEVDFEGDIYEFLSSVSDRPRLHLTPGVVVGLAGAIGWSNFKFLPPPPEEAQIRGTLHSRHRDAAAIVHHYDVSNAFYRLVLGPSMTYSCGVFRSADDTLEQAQASKYDLVCTKLGLEPGQRLLDVGCGWGGMLLHAATNYGVTGVGVTLSYAQEELARKRVAEAGLEDRIEIRRQDYRDIDDAPFDAISSIGMFEHVGRSRMEEYFHRLHGLLRPGGRLLNHAIGRPAYRQPHSTIGHLRATTRRLATAVGASYPSRIDSAFMQRYVFPDGELHEVGTVVSMLQEAALEVRHVESLREHYALTLRRWVHNLEANWDAAVDETSEGRSRVWRLYMAASVLGFERNDLQIHQVLATKTTTRGASHLPLRPNVALAR